MDTSTAHPVHVTARPLRLWPGVTVAIVVVLLRFVLPVFMPDQIGTGIIAGAAGALLIVLWWMFFSRAAWLERIGALVVTILVALAVRPFLHPSILGGMMGLMFAIYALPPVLGPAFVAWAAISRRMSPPLRWAALVVTVAAACGAWLIFRTDGIVNGSASQLAWRWTPTAEERLLARGDDVPKPAAAAAPAVERAKDVSAGASTGAPTGTEAAPSAPRTIDAAKAAARGDTGSATSFPTAVKASAADPAPATADWPGFRGPRRDGIIRGLRIHTDWAAKAPVEIWRKPVGPGWSSFAVQGDLFYTQEQRGEEEMVSAYRISTGEPVWRRRDPVRFWESNGGAGPRATPTLNRGRVYAFGATGILNALDARTGRVVWAQNVATDTGRRVPDWGFASSPLVVDDVVIVAASGTLAGYDAASGVKRWVGPAQRGSYSSPHLTTIDGVAQVLLMSGSGVVSISPATGAVLWQHDWQAGGTTITQPALTPDGGVLINAVAMAGGAGTRRIAVTHKADSWNVEERWTSIGLKPYFNDFVVHEGHAYGFDGNILACISLEDGTRRWKGGRYGNGQLVLLADQDVLLVLSEDGELALVNATTDKFTELAKVPALNGKTWNHPAVVGDVLLVRNGEEMAAFRLPAVR
jgi:outer membrane protein assembly factor BamB